MVYVPTNSQRFKNEPNYFSEGQVLNLEPNLPLFHYTSSWNRLLWFRVKRSSLSYSGGLISTCDQPCWRLSLVFSALPGKFRCPKLGHRRRIRFLSLEIIMKIWRVTSRREGHKTCYSSCKATSSCVWDTDLESRMNRGHRNGGFPHFSKFMFVCLFSWRYNPLWLYFHSPVAGFSLLVFEVSWSHTTTRHSR
jgi:hypothetical protein